MCRLVVRAGCLFVVACVPYWTSFDNGFHYDDFHTIVHNPHIRSLQNWPDFFTDSSLFSIRPESAMYRPLLVLSYAANYAFCELAPQGYHMVNMLLHGGNTILLYLLLVALRCDSKGAVIGALIFAVHPLNSEAVNYVSSRSELLMAYFFLLACVAYLRFADGGSFCFYVVAVFGGVLAILSKSVAVVLVGVLCLCDWKVGRFILRRWVWYLPFLLVAVAYLLGIRSFVFRALGDPVRPLFLQLWTQCKALVYYLKLSALPVNLSVEHQFFPAQSATDASVVVALAVIFSTLVLLVWRGSKIVIFAAAWALIVLLPTLLTPLIILVNEHRLYLAGVGAAAVAAWITKILLDQRRKVALLIVLSYTIILARAAWQREEVWRDELTLWSAAAAQAPLMVKPHLRLADGLAAAGRFNEAEIAYLTAVELRPQHPAARTNLGVLYRQTGRDSLARIHFEQILAVSPDVVAARLNLASVHLGSGNWREAQSHYAEALRYGHTNGVAQHALGLIADQFQGDAVAALEHYDQALTLAPMSARSLYLVHRAVTLRKLQRFVEAETSYREVLKIDPRSVEAWYNLANLYRDEGRVVEARRAYGRVMSLDDGELGEQARLQIHALQNMSR